MVDSTSKETETIIGIVESVKYKNEETGYTVCDLDCNGELVTAVGNLPFVYAGEEIKAYGNFTLHKNYGRQFNVEGFEKRLPTGTAALLKYLSSGAVKGVGAATAAKIVDVFGDDTLDIIENSPAELTKIRGITLKKAREISDALKAQAGIRNVMLFFSGFGFSPSTILKIWKTWGDICIDVVKENPYVLCENVRSISFQINDRVAFHLGFAGNSDVRISGAIKYVLRHNMSNGHTFLPKKSILSVVSSLVETTEHKVSSCLEVLVAQRELINVDINGFDAVYQADMYECEEYISKRLEFFSRDDNIICPVDDRIELAEKKNGIKYENLQRKAIRTAVEKKAMVLTGGPGTGKTTTLKAIIDLLEKLELKITLAAPTGRAAKRMEQLCGKEAKTIHRLLEMDYMIDETPKFLRCEDNPIDTDALILDEVSMVDVSLMDAVLRALPGTAKLILVGDDEQLPAVGPGNVLRDIIKGKKLPVITLSEIFRQSENSLIVTNAHKIISGEMPQLHERVRDFFFMKRESPEEVLDTVCDLAVRRLSEAYSVSPLTQIQILCPSRKDITGTATINENMREMLNPYSEKKRQRKHKDTVFREGDKVMQKRNNYDIVWKRKDGESGTGVYNGDIGIIKSIDFTSETLSIKFDDKIAVYDYTSLDDLEHAYAITVHKSQGSEFDIVVMPVWNAPPKLLYRNLLYTAVTRAKKIMVLVGSEGTVQQMVENVNNSARYTGLAYL